MGCFIHLSQCFRIHYHILMCMKTDASSDPSHSPSAIFAPSLLQNLNKILQNEFFPGQQLCLPSVFLF